MYITHRSILCNYIYKNILCTLMGAFLCVLKGCVLVLSRHRGHYDSDRRNRREIANSNERKRMQSINAGFQSLRSIVCPKMGEKLSKVRQVSCSRITHSSMTLFTLMIFMVLFKHMLILY